MNSTSPNMNYTNAEIDKMIELCEKQLKYIFKDKVWCLLALQTSGQAIMFNNQYCNVDNNDKLAILGELALRHGCAATGIGEA